MLSSAVESSCRNLLSLRMLSKNSVESWIRQSFSTSFDILSFFKVKPGLSYAKFVRFCRKMLSKKLVEKRCRIVFCRKMLSQCQMLSKNAVVSKNIVDCWRKIVSKNSVEEACRKILSKNLAEWCRIVTCCRKIVSKNAVEYSCRTGMSKNVVETCFDSNFRHFIW